MTERDTGQVDSARLFDLTDRVAVVTGAGGGLGTAICAGLAAHGADIALVDIDGETLRQSAVGVEQSGRRCLLLEADAADETAVAQAFERVDGAFGQVDILVNLAYTPTFGAPHELSLADWDKAWRVNVTSYFLAARQAAHRMIDAGTRRRDREHVLYRRHFGDRARLVPVQRRQGRNRDDDEGDGRRVGLLRDPRQRHSALPVHDSRTARSTRRSGARTDPRDVSVGDPA